MAFGNSSVTFISKKSLETAAFNILNKFNPKLNAHPNAVPIEEILENQFGLIMEYKTLSEKENDILGLITFSPGLLKVYDRDASQYSTINVAANTVIIDDRLLEAPYSEPRYRFTCAHEGAHWFLHKHLFAYDSNQGSLFDIESVQSKTIKCLGRNIEKKWYFSNRMSDEDRLEWQADYLASALLMPEKAFRKYFGEIASEYKLSAHSINSKLPNNIVASIIEILATKFQVSKQATRIRMYGLELVKDTEKQNCLL